MPKRRSEHLNDYTTEEASAAERGAEAVGREADRMAKEWLAANPEAVGDVKRMMVAVPVTIMDKIEERIVMEGEAEAEKIVREVIEKDIRKHFGEPLWSDVAVIQRGKQ